MLKCRSSLGKKSRRSTNALLMRLDRDDTNEGTIFTPSNTSSYAEMNIFLLSQYPELSREQLAMIDSMYPMAEQFPNTGAFWRTVSNAYGEMRYICPGIFISSAYSNYSSMSNWNYHYDVQDPDEVAAGLGVPHTVEVNAIWGPSYVTGTPPASYSTTNAAIVPIMQGYWTSFIRTYNPNTFRAPGTPRWLPWSAASMDRILIRTNSSIMENVPIDQRQRCAYLSGLGIILQQ